MTEIYLIWNYDEQSSKIRLTFSRTPLERRRVLGNPDLNTLRNFRGGSAWRVRRSSADRGIRAIWPREEDESRRKLCSDWPARPPSTDNEGGRRRERESERDRKIVLFFSPEVGACTPIYLPMYAMRACNNVAALVDLVLSLAPFQILSRRRSARRDNATLRGSRRRVLFHSHSCYSLRGPSLAVILETKYEVHTPCMRYISLCILLSFSLSRHRDLSRYILVSYKIPTGKDSLCRAFIHESHELWLSCPRALLTSMHVFATSSCVVFLPNGMSFMSIDGIFVFC